MMSDMFQSTLIPVLAEMVSFAQARQAVLAGNIANLSTPGYQARDLSVEEFQDRLKTALAERSGPGTSPGEASRPQVAGLAAASTTTLLRHDQGNVSMETQVAEMVKNQTQHNLALTIMTDQFQMFVATRRRRKTSMNRTMASRATKGTKTSAHKNPGDHGERLPREAIT